MVRTTLKVGSTDLTDLVSSLKVGYETLVSDSSGRNAKGDSFIDVVNRKIKVYVGFRYMSGAEMKKLMGAIKPYVVNITYYDAETASLKTIRTYTGTPEPDIYTTSGSEVLYKSFSLNFIQL